MLNFFHTYNPSPIIFQISRIAFYWYGLFMILGMLFGLFVILKLAKLYKIEKERVLDLSFLLIIFGIIGARLFAIFYYWDYFCKYPLDAFKIWQGGLSIHGAIIAGIIVLFFHFKRHKDSFWLLADLIVPGLILGQAIGRWGNYFNQELYGKPTSLFFGIPISLANRVFGYESFNYFHPAFLYESALNLIIFAVLIYLHKRRLKNNKKTGENIYGGIFLAYLILYSVNRFFLEFLRIDIQPAFLSLRFAQWISLLIVAISSVIIINRCPMLFVSKKGHKS
ncbi:MAG: prolipoprotein diacylglyceryl transferase [Parcubacteria group bacterium Athens1014_10]|nr:MAG: prolipoprotein diacylglyceryl transferase [Parcubacteria group bacterium Athens1014_10]TSD05243.1 MAG: prolipoprotein diacylglyceryl transferase [Parcubacteria group bacterium Athens0714_12]